MKRIVITICLISYLVLGCGKKEQPESEQGEEPNAVEVVAEPNEVRDVNVVEPNLPSELTEERPRRRPGGFDPNEGRGRPGEGMRRTRGFGEGMRRMPGRITDVNEPDDPNAPVPINLKNVEMKDIIKKIADWTGKVVIPDDELMKQKITIYSSKEVSKEKALELIYYALKTKGFTHKEENGTIVLKPIKDIKLENVPIIPPEQLLASLKDKTLVVQKFFKLESYSAANMAQIVAPLIGEHGHVSSDESTNTLMVIDTVGNLIRIEEMIQQFDGPEFGEETVTEIFELEYGDPIKIVQLLNQLLGTESTTGFRSFRSSRDSDRFRRSSFRSGTPSSQQTKPVTPKTSKVGAVTSVSIGVTKGPIILIAEPTKRWIIVRASAKDMENIRLWIEKFDVEREEEVKSDWEVIPLKHASASAVVDVIENNIREMPEEARPNVSIDALEDQKQLVIRGNEGDRVYLRKIIEAMDVPPRPDPLLFEETIPLKYLDSDETVEKLKEIYPVTAVSSTISRGYSPYRGRTPQVSEEKIYITSLPSQNAITVRAKSEELLKQIVARVKEWDVLPVFDEIKPRIVELRNTDPIKMTQMLNDFFGGEQGISGQSIFRLIYGTGAGAAKINKLYGKVIFQEVPGTKKILVASTIPEILGDIVKFVEELDEAEPGEMPRVVQLKYADCEDLIERLNAIFCEPGTQARIRRSEVGILEQTIQVEEDGGQQQEQGAPGEYTPPWSGSGARGRIGEELPISNVIGKVRFIPEPRTKKIIVLAPLEYIEEIVQLINELDEPGKQVMIKVVVVEVDKSKLDSVGMQMASDPTAFGALGENSVTALSQLVHQQSHGSMIFGAGGTSGNLSAVDLGMNVAFLLDFLVKYTDAKVINEQVLWTKDNETGQFFKGKEISLITQSSVSGQGIVTQGYERKKIGMTVRAKPNITPEKDVDMVMYLALSQLSQDLVNTQPVILETETKTNMIVKDGQTVLLASILTGEDSRIERKIPLLGDLPVLGGLFSHNGALKLNSELLVFITPTVIDEESNLEEMPEIKEALEKKEKVQQHLDEMAELLEMAK